MSLKDKARQLKRDLPALFLCLKDAETPILPKLLAGITIAYALSPVDLIPDFIPVLGYLDDVLLLPGLIALTIRLIPDDVWQKNREKAEGMWSNGRPKKWYYALPVIVIWLLVLWCIIKLIFRL